MLGRLTSKIIEDGIPIEGLSQGRDGAIRIDGDLTAQQRADAEAIVADWKAGNVTFDEPLTEEAESIIEALSTAGQAEANKDKVRQAIRQKRGG